MCSPAGVSTATQTLPTTGGAVVDIVGSNLGVFASTISMAYYGGSIGRPVRGFTVPTGCTVVVANSHIQCPSVAGVGANYTFVVTVAGGSSPNSTAMLSYSPPFISSVDGPGAVLAPAAGGVVVLLHGVRTSCVSLVPRDACGVMPVATMIAVGRLR
jgi:hypothetical protein